MVSVGEYLPVAVNLVLSWMRVKAALAMMLEK
jgi:hypothetical protein